MLRLASGLSDCEATLPTRRGRAAQEREMRIVGICLSALGGKGPVLLVVSLCVGVLIHPLAHFGYSLLPLSAFLLTLGSFLAAGLAPAESKIGIPLIGVVLAWVGVALPMAAAGLLSFVPLDPSLRAGVLLSLLAPPVGSAAAIAAMLGLQSRLALLVSIALTLLAPISIPGFAAVVAYLSLRFRQVLTPVLPDQRAATGVAVIGLIIVGLATSQGIQTQWHSNPARFEEMLAAAIAANFGLCALGALVFARLGLQTAGTIGLVSGNRNVTLAWAAASFGLPPLAEGYVAACVIPVLALPLIVRLGIALPSLIARLLQPSASAPGGRQWP